MLVRFFFFLGVGVAVFYVSVYNWKLGNRFREPLATCGLSAGCGLRTDFRRWVYVKCASVRVCVCQCLCCMGSEW